MQIHKQIALLFFLLSIKLLIANDVDSLKKAFNTISNPADKCKWIIELGYNFYNKNSLVTYSLNQSADNLCNIYVKNFFLKTVLRFWNKKQMP
ncbi:MAG: hypothetical protein KatS3mg035_1718 [Bacteroidia bacterium]|nr:MAG: hypothetical protein KatS3mg035_1718 [Bacteroidia bacterium]